MVGCDQLCLLPNQITESLDHFDYQYLWKESIDILTFCIEIVIKGRQHVRLSFPVKWGQVGFLSNLIAQFSDHQYLWKESIDLLNLLIFLLGDGHQGKVVSEIILWLGVVTLASCPTKLQNFCIINISGTNWVTSRIFFKEIIIKKREYLKLPLLVECVKVCFSFSQIAGFFDH